MRSEAKRSGASHAQSAVVFFAKAPIPGEVKTRLCPPLTGDEAASLHGSFVLDALERSAGLAKGKDRVDRFVACAPSREHVFFKVLADRYGVRLIDQQGDDVGQRMDAAFRELFAAGYRSIVLTGTDLPSLPASVYQEAIGLLSNHDMALGPALDGGYYLVALNGPQPELFRDMPWSTDRVLAMTQERAQQAGLRVGLLKPTRDIDTVADLKALMTEYGLSAGAPARGVGALSKRTEGALRLLAGRYPELKKHNPVSWGDS